MDSKRISEDEENNDEALKLPLKLLVLSELAPRDIQTGKSQVSNRIRIDKDNFKSISADIGSKIALKIPNRLSSTPDEIIVNLPLKDFCRPESIAESIPDLAGLLEIRELLSYLKDRKISKGEFQDRIDKSVIRSDISDRIRSMLFSAEPTKSKSPESPESKKADQNNALENLFEIVDVPKSEVREPKTAEEAVSHIISVFTSSSHDTADTSAVNSAIDELDSLLSVQINDIIHHKEFRRLEAAWSGLKFLIDRTDFRENIQIEVMSIPKEQLREVFHERIYLPEYEGITDSPISAVIADYEFDRSNMDTELLRELSVDLEAIRVPFISSIGPEFFDLSSADDIHSLPYLEKLSSPEYIKWNGLRESESSRWVVLAFNRFLLRMPYGDDNPTRKFKFHEAGNYHLWGNPVWCVGSLLAGSFARSGWATEITGTRNGVIENLPVRQYKDIQIPLETFINSQLRSDLAKNGIAALACNPNSDSALFLSIPTPHIPEIYSDDRLNEKSLLKATLPYQLFASRVVSYIGLIHDSIIPGNTERGIEEDLSDAILNFIAAREKENVRVTVNRSRDRQGYYDVSVQIRSGRNIMGGSADLDLQWQARIQ